MSARQIILSIFAIVLSWYAMMAVHEAGHCLGAIVTGAEIENVKVPLFGFSRTDVSNASHPAAIVWAGPVIGSLFPSMLLVFSRKLRRGLKHILIFFIGFCLLANGIYLGAGVLVNTGDAGDLFRLGMPVSLLIIVGIVLCAGGLYAWHRMGPLSCWFSDKP